MKGDPTLWDDAPVKDQPWLVGAGPGIQNRLPGKRGRTGGAEPLVNGDPVDQPEALPVRRIVCRCRTGCQLRGGYPAIGNAQGHVSTEADRARAGQAGPGVDRDRGIGQLRVGDRTGSDLAGGNGIIRQLRARHPGVRNAQSQRAAEVHGTSARQTGSGVQRQARVRQLGISHRTRRDRPRLHGIRRELRAAHGTGGDMTRLH